MSRGRKTEGVDFTRPVWINLGNSLGQQVNAYMHANGYTDATSVVRELISIAMSGDPQHAVNQNARKKAYDDIRTALQKRMFIFLNELGTEVYAELKLTRPQEAEELRKALGNGD